MPRHNFEGFTKISSDHMDGAQYNSIDRKMRIRFKNGYVYEVHGISADSYQQFMDAKSQGEHWHQNIRDQYHIERVR